MDTGIDDSLALLYATSDTRIDLLAVTTCAGNADLDSTTRNSLSVLELAGAGEIEVARGRPGPLARPLVTSPEAHGPGGIGRAVLPPPAASASPRSAVELISESALRRPGELILVALGPLTNVATAVLAEPRLPHMLRRLVIMGGPRAVVDGALPAPDRNSSVDPEAAALVYREFGQAGAPLPLVIGLDVTRTVKLVPHDLDALRARAGNRPLVGFVEDALGFYFDYHESRFGFRGAFMHDPFVVEATFDSGLIETRPRSISVEPGVPGGPGTAVAEDRPGPGTVANAEVATRGSGEPFVQRLIDRLVDLA